MVLQWAARSMALAKREAVLSIALLLAVVSGVPQGADGLFTTYFYSMPLLILLFLFIFSASLATANLNLAIAMGWTARLLSGNAADTCGLHPHRLGADPAHAPHPSAGQLGPQQTAPDPSAGHWPVRPALSLLCLAILVVGGLAGLLMARSKALGIFVMFVAILVSIAGVVVLALAGMGLFDLGFTPLFLPISVAVLLAILVLGEYLLWRCIRRYVVR